MLFFADRPPKNEHVVQSNITSNKRVYEEEYNEYLQYRTNKQISLPVATAAVSYFWIMGYGLLTPCCLTSPNSSIAYPVTNFPNVIHKCLGHPSLFKLQKMVSSLSRPSTLNCESYKLGKHTQTTFQRSDESRAQSIFSLVHSDI